MSAATAATAVIGCAVPGAALAEDAEAPSRGSEIKRVRTCCRGCGKMECGVWVTVENGRAVKVEGDQSSFQSSGNCCGKSQSSLQAAYHPDRIYHPMKRTNPKGEEPGWQRITWDEAMETIGSKFQEIMDQYGGQSIFNMCGTSRQWVYGPYAFYKWLFDTPNAHVASEICKGPRRLMGWISSVDGAPWMALRDGPRVYVQWGTAPENSNYDDSCRNLVDRMSAAETHICIDPRLSGSGKEADYWLNLEPGTDGALALAWQHILIEKDLIDWEFVKRWTDASLLVVEDMEPTGGRYLDLSSPIQVPALQDLIGTKLKTRLLKEMDLVEGGSPHKFMAWNKKANDGKGGLVYWDTDTTQWQGCNHVAPTRDQMEVVYAGTSQEGYLPPISYWELEEAGIDFDLEGEHEVTLADGTKHIARPVWSYLAKSVADCTPEWASEITGLDPQLIEESCTVWATRPEGQTYGNGGIHLNLAPDQIGNCAQTVRAVLNLIYSSGNFDGPAGNRGLSRTPVDEQATAAPGTNMPQEVKWTLKGMEALTGEPMCPPMYLADKQVDPMNIPDRREVLGQHDRRREVPAFWPYYNEWADATCIWKACLGEGEYPLKGGINESGSFMNMSNANACLGGALEAGLLGGHQHVPSPRHRDGRHHPAVPALDRDQQHPRVPGRFGRHRAHAALHRAAGRHEVRLRHQPPHLRGHRERQGNPNGTWTNIAGDAPGAYHHDDRLEDWFQAHNEVSGFGRPLPGLQVGALGGLPSRTSRRTAGSTPR